jgi:hypothetical protein
MVAGGRFYRFSSINIGRMGGGIRKVRGAWSEWAIIAFSVGQAHNRARIQSQKSSTKFQINLKFQYPMTQTGLEF